MFVSARIWLWKCCRFFFWPSSLSLWKRVKASTRLCSASSVMSLISFSNLLSSVIFGFAIHSKDFGQVRFVVCSSNSFIECSVFAILLFTVSLWSVYFLFRPHFGTLDFSGLLALLLVGGQFSLCPFGGVCKFRVGLGCDGGGLLPKSSFSSPVFSIFLSFCYGP